MASSGWQNEIWIHTVNNYLQYKANIRVDGITHSGTNLRVWGAIALCCRPGSSGGGGTQTVNNGIRAYINGSGGSFGTFFRQGTDYYVGFDTTFYNVAVTATSYTVTANFSSCYNSSCSSTYWTSNPAWTISFSQSASTPSGLSVSNISSTWNTVTGTYSVGNWGGTSAGYMAARVFGATGDARLENQFNGQSSVTTTVTNSSIKLDGGITIKGCGEYRVDLYASNSAGATNTSDITTYTPPAPGQFSYTDPGTVGTKIYPVTFTGVTANNVTDYTQSELVRTVRYKVGSGSWVYVEESVQKTIDATTTFNVSIPASTSAQIEGWMSYRGLASESASVVITNSNAPVHYYGSAEDETHEVIKMYGSLNGETVKITKFYGSVDGVTRKVFEDI